MTSPLKAWTSKFFDHTILRPGVVVMESRYFHLGFAGLWGVYALWALTTILTTLGSLDMTLAGAAYLFAFKVAIGLLSLAAFIGAFFLVSRLEFYALILFSGFLATYFVVLAVLTFGGHIEYAAQAVLVFSLLIPPLLRMRFLFTRIKGTGTGA